MNRGWGRIVNMSSLSIHSGGGPGQVAYAASKAGVVGLTRGCAKEFASRGINVNCVVPGLILGTPLHDTFTTVENQKIAISATPLRRGGTPEDVADTVLFLVSDLARFVTGEAIEINGGSVFA
jgi:3-oxoacyl-[acyl-carrier protein] reductase